MQTFSKQERLCGKKQIDNLFATGESFKEGSFAVIWKTQKGNPEFPAQIIGASAMLGAIVCIFRNAASLILLQAIAVGVLVGQEPAKRPLWKSTALVGSPEPSYSCGARFPCCCFPFLFSVH